MPMIARARRLARASLVCFAVAATLACSSVATLGCGAAGSSVSNPPSGAVRAVVATAVAQTSTTYSVHDRVMAEQGRDAEAAAKVDLNTPATMTAAATAASVVANNLQPPTTAPSPASADPQATTAVVLTDGQTPLVGVWSGTAEQLAKFLTGVAPSPRFTVSALALAGYYVRYCAEAGLRADLLWAQMIHETGYGMYGGDCSPEQNNYAGIGATGGGVAGASFPTAEAGVIAQVAHMVAYVYSSSPVAWANSTTDPRFDLVSPRGAASALADLNGRWAVPGTSYGQNIEKIVRSINSR
jgi:N-acetylmuramoyl-L-alanine amidase